MSRVVVVAVLMASAHVDAACEGPPGFSLPPVELPKIAAFGKAAEDFVPQSWRLLESASGDFDRDGREDIALAIAGDQPAYIIRNECMLGPEEFDTNPVAIVVALKQADGRYQLASSDFDIIPRRETPTMAPPFKGLKAVKNVLHVGTEQWQSAGTWQASSHEYLFRFDSGCMKLIGLEYRSLHRATGQEKRISANFSTGRYFVSEFSPETKVAPKTWFTMEDKSLICLGDVPENLVSQRLSSSGEPHY